MNAEERSRLIERYEAGPRALRDAWERVPPEARTFRPTASAWSAHQIVVHCADSETSAYNRIRFLLAEDDPLIQGYDQDIWARVFDYESLPVEPAFAVIDAVHASTAAMLRNAPDAAWDRSGRHTESGTYSAKNWLSLYSEHLHEHVAQIEANVAAWKSSSNHDQAGADS